LSLLLPVRLRTHVTSSSELLACFDRSATSDIYILSLHDALPILFQINQESRFMHNYRLIFLYFCDAKGISLFLLYSIEVIIYKFIYVAFDIDMIKTVYSRYDERIHAARQVVN